MEVNQIGGGLMSKAGKWIGGFLIISIIIGVIIDKVFKKKLDKLNKSWDDYKCKPYIVPFAGTIFGPKDGSVNPASNFYQCLKNQFQEFFDHAMSPFRNIIKSIIGILVIFKSSIQKIRVVLSYIRNAMRQFARDVYLKLKKSYAQIAFIINRIRRIFKYLTKTLVSLFDALSYVIWSLKSLWKGPVGKVARMFCFDGDTIITINNKQQKIKDVSIVGNVIGILEFSAENVDMYNYKEVIVSGSHIVYENNIPILVKDSIHSYKINYRNDKIYCINTKDNIIMINGIKFGDYEEINDPITMNKALFGKYNTKYRTINNEYNYIHGDTEIKMRNNIIRKIKDIKVGDWTTNGEVYGIIKVLNNHTVYKYKNDMMTGSQIIKQNDIEWHQICDIGNKIIMNDSNYLYHIMTNGVEIETNNCNIITNYE
jgi:hypothetical protein